MLENNFKEDEYNFSEKTNKIPIYRFSNVRANLFIPSRFKLVELSYKNPTIIDCKGGSSKQHKGHGDYVIRKGFIKLYKHLNIIDKSIDEDKFLEYFKCDNYINKDELLDYKYLITNDSWYNNVDYCLYNSVLMRYKLEKSCYYEDMIFEDNKDVVMFDENIYKEKYEYVLNNEKIMLEMIENRKNKVHKYLKYDRLVEHYGMLLSVFSRIQKTNEIN